MLAFLLWLCFVITFPECVLQSTFSKMPCKKQARKHEPVNSYVLFHQCIFGSLSVRLFPRKTNKLQTIEKEALLNIWKKYSIYLLAKHFKKRCAEQCCISYYLGEIQVLENICCFQTKCDYFFKGRSKWPEKHLKENIKFCLFC